jgi:hypothetical protein
MQDAESVRARREGDSRTRRTVAPRCDLIAQMLAVLGGEATTGVRRRG